MVSAPTAASDSAVLALRGLSAVELSLLAIRTHVDALTRMGYASVVDLKKQRRNLLKRYGPLYVRMFFREGVAQVCTYCGNVADTEDHVPPLTWVYCLGTSYFNSNGIRMLMVPACGECNAELGHGKLFTIKERTRYLIGRYEKKYQRFIRGLIWDMEEIDELGRGLKRYIEGHRTCQIGIDRRIKILEEGLRRVP